MKKLYLFVSLLLPLVGVALCNYQLVQSKLQEYVCYQAEQRFGTQPIAQIHEKKIRTIADRMGTQEPFTIHKMNAQSTQAVGYHNAFALQPLLFGCIPVGQRPFLFVSEGFFEDLSHEEQEFLIGHELIHIEQAHLRYFNLLAYLSLIPIVLLLWLMRRKIRLLCGQRIWVYCTVLIVTFLVGDCAIDLVGLAYQRSIEREADSKSLALLKSYDGGLSLIRRWQKEFKMPLHNNWWGLFSDHPSCHERITYFSQAKQQHERSNYA